MIYPQLMLSETDLASKLKLYTSSNILKVNPSFNQYNFNEVLNIPLVFTFINGNKAIKIKTNLKSYKTDKGFGLDYFMLSDLLKFAGIDYIEPILQTEFKATFSTGYFENGFVEIIDNGTVQDLTTLGGTTTDILFTIRSMPYPEGYQIPKEIGKEIEIILRSI